MRAPPARTPGPAEVEASLRALPGRYRRDRAPRTPRRYRVVVAGLQAHTLVVDAERCVVVRGAEGHVAATLQTDAETWLSITDGRLLGVTAFLGGRLRIDGDLNEALRIETLFSLPTASPGALAHARMARHRVGRVTLSTFETGPLDAPVVVLLHGLGASKVSLLPTIAGLSTSYRVVAVDLPGFGKSTAPLGLPYDAPFFARTMLGLLDDMGVPSAALVGNSLGGRVALEVALRAPERVQALGLLCPALAFDAYAPLRPFLSRSRADVLGGLAVWPIPAAAVDRGLRQLFADASRVPADNLRAARHEFLRSIRAPARRLAFLATARHLGLESPEHYWPRLAGLRPPSLWIFGDRDPLVPGRYAAVVRRHAPSNATIECWRSSGHVPQFEHPQRTLQALRQLLDEATGGPPPTRPAAP
jgi:pimeloyl-ACP methyl ester carboxylesterase